VQLRTFVLKARKIFKNQSFTKHGHQKVGRTRLQHRRHFKRKIAKVHLYALAIDENTDYTDTAQVAISVRGVDGRFNFFEELLAFSSLIEQTTGIDILQTLKVDMDKNWKFLRR